LFIPQPERHAPLGLFSFTGEPRRACREKRVKPAVV
jgi:hypothetical protein